ncbi:MAG: alpha/beta fold hydrolase [Phycisphaerae bacterium]|nr:alpha/beta fold hydrolase [Phycisphaerae bacterium]
MKRFQSGFVFGMVAIVGVFGAVGGAVGQDKPTMEIGKSKRPPPDFSDRKVTFNTPDGITIEADFYPVKVEVPKRTPAVVLIHMYPKNRSSWKEFVPDLRAKGIAVLAYDIRGTGGSTKPESMNLTEQYKARSTALFQLATLDAVAAFDFLRQQEYIDTSRVALIGASVGCTISLDFANQTSDAKAIVCLSPGVNYFDLDSLATIKTAASYLPILLISPEAEYDAVEKLAEVGGARVETEKYPGGKEYHGTNMLSSPFGDKVRERILAFLVKNLEIKDEKKSDDDKKKKVTSDDDSKGEKDKKKKSKKSGKKKSNESTK